MKRLLKSWVFWLSVVPFVAALLAGGVSCRTDYLQCACGSFREETAWRLGVSERRSLPVSSVVASESPSAFFSEILGAAHFHVWFRSNYESASLWGKAPRPIRVLTLEPLDIAYFYRQEPGFRAWLKNKVEAGLITPGAIQTDLSTKLNYPEGQYPFGWTPP